MAGQKFDTQRRTTVRQLRMREDTAKYLLNLDPNSAHYDPKTRAMRGNPLPNKNPEDGHFAGDNQWRNSGDITQLRQQQVFANQAYDRGSGLHLEAAPTRMALAHEEFKRKKEQLVEHKGRELVDQYGGEAHMKSVPKALLLGQTERFVEYNADGTVVGSESVVPSSKWPEDVLNGNHTAVWGSYWENGSWGYACCHQTMKNAYCVPMLKERKLQAAAAAASPAAEAAAGAAASSVGSKRSRSSPPSDDPPRKKPHH